MTWLERNADRITVAIALLIPIVLPLILAAKAPLCAFFGCVPVGGVSP